MKRARLAAALAFATLTVPDFMLGFSRAAQAAGPDPAAETTRLLSTLAAPEAHDVDKNLVTKAKSAQQRAASARGAGDLQHATELDSLALVWAQAAGDLVRAAAAEKQLADLQKSATDLEQKAIRTQALIEQTIARKGRAEQNLAHETEPAAAKNSSSVQPAMPKPVPTKSAPARPAGAAPMRSQP